MKLSTNFSTSELACHDGTQIPDKYVENARKIASRVQVLRDFLGVPIKVNSGYRTPSYNKQVGGELHSYHLTASAMDITTDEYSPKELAMIWEGLIRLKLIPNGGLGVYGTFIHVDIGPPGRRWHG